MNVFQSALYAHTVDVTVSVQLLDLTLCMHVSNADHKNKKKVMTGVVFIFAHVALYVTVEEVTDL